MTMRVERGVSVGTLSLYAMLVQDYLAHGVEWVWVIDPDERRALSYSPANPGGALVDELRTQNPDLLIPLADVLSVLD